MNSSMWGFFITRRRFTLLLALAITLLGFVSLYQIPKESNPEVNVPIGIVSTALPGAGAKDVEELVTNPLEDRILSLSEITSVISSSREGVSLLTVQFDARADSDRKVDELKDAVDEVVPDLPDEALDPVVTKVRFSDIPIYTFSLSGPYDLVQLTAFGEELQSNLERISGVSKVSLVGGKKREVRVEASRADLDQFGLTLGDLTRAISQANADVPVGETELDNLRFTLRLEGALGGAEDVADVPVTQRGDAVIYISDVAEVLDDYKEETHISRLSTGGGEALPAVQLNVFKSSGGNILRLVDKVEETIEKAKEDFLPEGSVTHTTQDHAQFIRDDLGNLLKSGLFTIALVFLLLFLFLGFKEALLAGLAVPLTFFITFTLLSLFGLTLNFLSLFSLLLALGILIDSAIVMVEGMHDFIHQGESPVRAAYSALATFRAPLVAGTLTTVFAFLPMLLTSGIVGEFVKHIPITVSLVLLSSLFVAFAFIPAFGARALRREKIQPKRNGRRSFFRACISWYERVLAGFLERRRSRMLLYVFLLVAFFGSLALPVTGILRVEMFPPEDLDNIYINVKLPIGTPLEHTSNALLPLESVLREDSRVSSFAITVGSLAQVDVGAPSEGEHLAHFTLTLSEDREEPSTALIDQYQPVLAEVFPEGEISVLQPGSGPGVAAPVVITIQGAKLETLEEWGHIFEEIVADVPGTTNVGSSIQEPTNELVISIDRAKARVYGVSTAELADALRATVFGTEATIIRSAGEEIPVVTKGNKLAASEIESLTLYTSAGEVPVGAFADIALSGGRPSVLHEDGERVVRVTSYTKEGVSAAQVFRAVSKEMNSLSLPAGYEVRMGGEAEDVDQSFSDMFRAMIVAVILIGVALVVQFRSYRQPLFILAAIPLALIGVFPGLVVVGLPLSFPAIIGVVALAGVVVNDAIILIDQINNNRRRGLVPMHAIQEAAASRFQPIILTTITTIAGIIPLTLSSTLWGPLGFSIIFGLAFATVLTLLVVPLLYFGFAEDELETDE